MPSPARRFEKRPPPSLAALVQRVDAQRPGEITGDTVPTGFGSLDKVLGGGMRRRDLILLGGDMAAASRRSRWASRSASHSRRSAWGSSRVR